MTIFTFAITFEFALAFTTTFAIISEFAFAILSWSSLLCTCLFANDSRTQNLRSLYHEHMNSSLNHVSRCSWYQQAKRAQESYHLRKHELKMKSKIKQKAKKLLKQQDEIRIAQKRAERYVCRRCKSKFDSNIKLHEHIRTRHAKKSKSAQQSIVSSFASSSQSITFSSSTSSKLVIMSLATSSKFLSEFLSIATSRKSISWAKIVARSIVAFKFSRLSIATSKSIYNILKKSTVNCSLASFISSRTFTSSRLYLIVNDLYRMFVEKSSSFDLQRHQMRSFSSKILDKNNCDLIQTRITSYFNATISFAFKSIKSKAFESTHARENLSRQFSISLSISSISFSFRFSKIFRSTSVCKHCQERFVIYWSISWVMSIASRVENREILIRVHSLTIKRFARSRFTLRKYWLLLEEVTTLKKLACCLFVCFIRSLLLYFETALTWES